MKKTKLALFVVSVMIVVAVVFVSTIAVQQKVEQDSQAIFKQPTISLQEERDTTRTSSEAQPSIRLVWPFLGKENDMVFIYGLGFGDSPINTELWIGDQVVERELISTWQDNFIEFLIPKDTQGGEIKLITENGSETWNFPFTIYDSSTQVQVFENEGVVWARNCSEKAKITLFMQSGKILSSDNAFEGLAYSEDDAVVSVMLTDSNNTPIPFWVEPADFGF